MAEGQGAAEGVRVQAAVLSLHARGRTSGSMDEAFRQIVTAAGAREEVRCAVEELYRDIEAAVNARRPVCVMSGRCCRFEEYGHRLFVTTMELACFAHDLRNAIPAGWDGKGCPFQAGKLCSVHAIRPMGCRLFYCDPTAEQWQNELYERLHSRLKQLHEELAVPYRYMEWREALAAVLPPSPHKLPQERPEILVK